MSDKEKPKPAPEQHAKEAPIPGLHTTKQEPLAPPTEVHEASKAGDGLGGK